MEKTSNNLVTNNKILVIWPLSSPMYISDFWRCSLVYEVSAHLRRQGYVVDIFDGCEHKTYSDLFKVILSSNYDVFLLNAPLDAMDGFTKTLKYIRILDKLKPIYVYGLSTLLSPSTFKNLDIQGYSNSGYFEKGILSFLGNRDNNCTYKQDDKWIDLPCERGNFLDWSFMDINDVVKFPVLGMSISRGCQGGCNFCNHAMLHGKYDVRKPINDVCDYFEVLEKTGYTGIIEFISPTFTINKDWVCGFCSEYKNRNLNIKWRCVTRVDEVEPHIIKFMADANCVRIGLGVETMVVEEQEALKKEIQFGRIIQAIKIIQENKIEAMTYLISGIENQTGKSLIQTYKTLKKFGVTIKISALLRYRSLKFEDMIDTSIASDMSTSSLNTLPGINNYDLLKLIIGCTDID